MNPYSMTPGVYIEETRGGEESIQGTSTSETAFVDYFASGPMNEATRVTSLAEFERLFGGLDPNGNPDVRIGLDPRSEASYGILQFFLNGGSVAWVVRINADHDPGTPEWIEGEGAAALLGSKEVSTGMYALASTSFNILCLPAAAYLLPSSLREVYVLAAGFCNEMRAFLIVDIPPSVDTSEKVVQLLNPANPDAILRDKNAAIYFPRLTIADPLSQNSPRNVGPSGTMAGVYARTDEQRGVWKAPAGTDASLKEVTLITQLSDSENGIINPLGINALRNFPAFGNVCWGARTLEGADSLGSEWKYIPVRRTALHIERSIYEGTKWSASEPNDEPLWSRMRLSVGQFMQDLFRAGAFQGSTPKDAYFVKCDGETTTQRDIDLGLMNIMIGFAPLKPAEFVIINITQIAGQALP